MQVFIAESLVWFQASGFYYTIDARPSLGLFLRILLLPCVVEILQVMFLHVLQQAINGADVGAGQVITLGLGLGSCKVWSTRWEMGIALPWLTTLGMAHPILH